MAFERKPAVKKMSSDSSRRHVARRKGCRFCADATNVIDYKEAENLSNFLTERGKIIPRRISGNCAKHQRKLCEAIKRARNIALLPFAGRHFN